MDKKSKGKGKRTGLLIFAFVQNPLACHCNEQLRSSSTIASNADNKDGGGVPLPIPNFTLANGITIPLVGLGSASGVAYPHIRSAVEEGYRYVDTAQSHSWGYREEDVGKAVRDAKRRYEDWPDDSPGDYVYVQTKIHPQDLGYHSTQKAIKISMERMKVSSLDSVLLHKPHCWEGVCDHEPEGTWHDSWVALEEAVDSGIVRSIGICDVDDHLLDELLQKRIGPMVIQNWFDPFHQDKKFRRRVKQHNEQHPERKILYQGYSSLGTQWHHFKGYEENPVMNHLTLVFIAEEHGVTVPQVVIQWATRQGVMVLPASRNRAHQASNLNSFCFILSDKEMSVIDGMDDRPPPKTTKEKDPNEVEIQFFNLAKGPMNAYWVPEGGTETDYVHVGEMKATGDVLKLTSYHGHTFVFKDGGDGDARKNLNHHVVDISIGSWQKHGIADESEEL